VARLFGTDGVRGVANEFLTPELAFALGRAGGHVLAAHGEHRPVVVGRDTRCSGPMLEAALCAGVCSIGLDAITVGVLPTPGVAWLTRHLGAGAGVMISASHNPIEDNGIKFFAADGCKLSDQLEDEIASHVTDGAALARPTGPKVGTIQERRREAALYGEHCRSLGDDLSGMVIVVDGGHGAAYEIAPKVFSRLGARVIKLHCTPNGRKINVRCGSTDLTGLRAAVLAHPGSVGVAFDGDADRALFVDEDGAEVTGDHVLAMRARELLSRGELPGQTVVATVMSNIGLERAFERLGVLLIRTPVGDRYVLEAMQKGGFRLGGEQSGHIIDLHANTTGDGLATAVSVLRLAREHGKLATAAAIMRRHPQVLVNVVVSDKAAVQSSDGVQSAIEQVEQELGADGRVLVRPSGTEPLVRVMIEGREENEIRRLAQRIADAIQVSGEKR
jgi:phosphoglucosamine mutase